MSVILKSFCAPRSSEKHTESLLTSAGTLGLVLSTQRELPHLDVLQMGRSVCLSISLSIYLSIYI